MSSVEHKVSSGVHNVNSGVHKVNSGVNSGVHNVQCCQFSGQLVEPPLHFCPKICDSSSILSPEFPNWLKITSSSLVLLASSEF